MSTCGLVDRHLDSLFSVSLFVSFDFMGERFKGVRRRNVACRGLAGIETDYLQGWMIILTGLSFDKNLVSAALTFRIVWHHHCQSLVTFGNRATTFPADFLRNQDFQQGLSQEEEAYKFNVIFMAKIEFWCSLILGTGWVWSQVYGKNLDLRLIMEKKTY